MYNLVSGCPNSKITEVNNERVLTLNKINSNPISNTTTSSSDAKSTITCNSSQTKVIEISQVGGEVKAQVISSLETGVDYSGITDYDINTVYIMKDSHNLNISNKYDGIVHGSHLELIEKLYPNTKNHVLAGSYNKWNEISKSHDFAKNSGVLNTDNKIIPGSKEYHDNNREQSASEEAFNKEVILNLKKPTNITRTEHIKNNFKNEFSSESLKNAGLGIAANSVGSLAGKYAAKAIKGDKITINEVVTDAGQTVGTAALVTVGTKVVDCLVKGALKTVTKVPIAGIALIGYSLGNKIINGSKSDIAKEVISQSVGLVAGAFGALAGPVGAIVIGAVASTITSFFMNFFW